MNLKLRQNNYLNFIISIIFGLTDSLTICRQAKIKPKTLLLIRLDAIGDYILFRNFIEILKKSKKYKDYKITLLGNKTWKDLSENLDKTFIDEFIFINLGKFKRNPFYRYKKLKKIASRGYETIINPVYSREFYGMDSIIKKVYAREKIGSIGNLSNIKKWQKKISDKYYTRLMPVENKIMFEFYRNKEFFENLLGEKIDVEKPYINYKQLTGVDNTFQLPEKYVVLFIGASGKNRKWPIKKFAEVGKFLKKNYGFEIVLCGTEKDSKDVRNFKKKYNEKFLNFVGRTSLVDIIKIIKKASLLISNETFAPHMSVALNTPVLVIYNGNHFGRFVPCPKEITHDYHVVYHPKIEKGLDNYKKLSNTYGYDSKLDINEISSDKLIEKLDRIVPKNI